MSYLMRSVSLVAAIMIVVGMSAQTPVQTTSGNQSQSPNKTAEAPDVTIKAKTQVVLLDVIANDSHGNPVKDLKREDFTVIESGKPQTVASFDVVDIARPAAAYKAMPPKLPPGVFTNKLEAMGEEGQLTVLLLDSLNTPWADQSYARGQMLKYLKKNHQPGKRMAIYYLSTKLYRLQDFTTDPELLERALQRHKGDTSPLIDDPNEPPVDTSILTGEMAAGLAAMQENEAAIRMDLRVQLTLDALKAIARVLGGYPGRKKLIWVSGSFPANLEPGENSGFSSQRTYSNDIIQTTSLLRDSQVAVYTVDAQGLVGLQTASAQFSGRTGSGRAMTGPQLAQVNRAQLNMLNASHESARELAEGTGGLAFYNRNDLDTAVMKSVADGAIYYALSYSPEDKDWNGRYRKVEVKVNRPGVELRYRKGYFARDPQAIEDQSPAMVQSDLDAAMMTVLTSPGVTFYASALPLDPPAKTGEAPNPNAIRMVDVRFLVEPRDIFFQATKDNKRQCSIQFAVGVFNSDKIVKSASKRLDCNVGSETYAKLLHDGIMFEVPVEMTDQQARIRLLVRDNFSGKIGSLDVSYPQSVVPGRAKP